jgi:hypothetical protein
MNLLNLAPDIQEQLLHLPRVERGRDPVTERELNPNSPLSSDDPALVELLASHVKTVFSEFDGKVGMND